MKYMGIDASSTCTGVAIFEDDNLIYHGAIKPPKGLNWRDRITVEGKEIENIIKQYRPSCIYMEDVPLMGKQMSTLVLLGGSQRINISKSQHY